MKIATQNTPALVQWLESDRDTVITVRYTKWIDADFGPEPTVAKAGPFDSEATAQYWIDEHAPVFEETIEGYPNPTIEHTPIITREDLE